MTCCMLGILLILGTELSPEFHALLEGRPGALAGPDVEYLQKFAR